MAALNFHAARGVAAREFPLLHGRAAGVVEAKPEGHTLTGVEAQPGKYGDGLPDTLPYYVRPLPFLYESTGVETRFTNGLDPQPRSRNVCSFHTTETLAEWLGARNASVEVSPDRPELIADAGVGGYRIRHNLCRRLMTMPPLDDSNLWQVQAQLGAVSSRGRRALLCRWRPVVARRSWPATKCTGSSGTPAPGGCCSSLTAATAALR